jgi:DNA replication protein DnaC
MWASTVVGIISALVSGGTAIASGVSNKRAREEAQTLANEQQQAEDVSTAKGRQIAQQKAQNDAISLANDKKAHATNMLKANEEMRQINLKSYKATTAASAGRDDTASKTSYDNNISLNRSISNLMR